MALSQTTAWFQMSFTKSQNNLEYVVKKSYLDFQGIAYDSEDSALSVSSIDPLTGGEVQVSGYLDSNGEIDKLVYRHTGGPGANTLDDVSISAEIINPDAFLHVIQDYIDSPIPLDPGNVQSFTDNWASLQGVRQTAGSDVFVLLGGGELGIYTESF